MKVAFQFNKPKTLRQATGLHSSTFNDDFTFTFEAKDVHTTDSKEIEEMFAALDQAVRKFKEALTRG